MRRPIDEPLEQLIEAAIDVPERLERAYEEVKVARDELAMVRDNEASDIPRVVAKERLRHARIVLDYWQRRAAYERQVFKTTVDNYVFHIIGVLAPLEIQPEKGSESFTE